MGWLKRALGRGRGRVSRDANASVRRALLALLSHDGDEAEAELAAAARSHPQDVDVFRALALLYRQQGEFARAIHMHQALLLRRDLDEGARLEILGELAEDFRKAGLIRRAAAAYEEVLIHAPRDRHALAGLARLLQSLREHGRALEMTRRLAREEGRSAAEEEAALLVLQAEAAHAEGRSDDARRAVKRARRRHRGHAPAHVLLGTLEAERGHNEAALAAWREAVEVDSRSGAFVYPRLEAAFASAGRTREFEGFLRRLLEKRPDDVAARLALARALAAWGEVDAAVAELRTLLERDAGFLPAQAARVRVLLEAGREREALAALPGLLKQLEHEEPGAPRESSA
jgi:lipopolysaccharide biosynthesis regulator YciM